MQRQFKNILNKVSNYMKTALNTQRYRPKNLNFYASLLRKYSYIEKYSEINIYVFVCVCVIFAVTPIVTCSTSSMVFKPKN